MVDDKAPAKAADSEPDYKWSKEELEKIEKLEKQNKKLLGTLVGSEIWDVDSRELRFAKFMDPKWRLKIMIYDEKKSEFTDKYRAVSGAEYREAYLNLALFGGKKKLDEEDRKALYVRIFGQETFPDVKTEKDPAKLKANLAAYNRGMKKLREYSLIIGGEFASRPIEPKAVDKNKEAPAETPAKPGGMESSEQKDAGMDMSQIDIEPSMLRRNSKKTLAAIDSLIQMTDEMASGTSRVPAELTGSLVTNAETQLDEALTGRNELTGVPFKAVTQIAASLKKMQVA